MASGLFVNPDTVATMTRTKVYSMLKYHLEKLNEYGRVSISQREFGLLNSEEAHSYVMQYLDECNRLGTESKFKSKLTEGDWRDPEYFITISRVSLSDSSL